jgi:hypothetical protein
MIEVPGEADQNYFSNIFNGSQISKEFKGSQINQQQWYSFFTMIDKINNSKFDTLLWFQVQNKKCFKIKEKEDKYFKKAWEIFNYEGIKPITLAKL